MTDRVVVKDNWVDAVNDQVSEFFGTCMGFVLLGGLAVTGCGMASGYMSTPKGQDPAPLMVQHTVEAHRVTIAAGITFVETTWNWIQDQRPES